MTVIVSTVWDSRISIVVDRRISRRLSRRTVEIVDDDSNKVLVVQCRGALFAVAYTGIAVAHEYWMDCVIANCLAHQKLSPALAQPGAWEIARPAYTLINELRLNLNGALNSDPRARVENIELLIQGWEYGKKRIIPFSCKLKRGPVQSNGNRYFELIHHPLRKFFRENPNGFWGESLGDDGGAITEALQALGASVGFTHDDVERHLRQAVLARSAETHTVSPSAVAVQLDPRVNDGQATFTYYPHEPSANGHPLLSPWVMTPRMLCSPSISTSAFSPRSACGKYVLGGFSDGNTHLHVVTRLPIEHKMAAENMVLHAAFQPRPLPP